MHGEKVQVAVLKTNSANNYMLADLLSMVAIMSCKQGIVYQVMCTNLCNTWMYPHPALAAHLRAAVKQSMQQGITRV